MKAILTLKTITPLHVGTGQAVGTTDLPISRERHTEWPNIPGSGVKGVLKDMMMVKTLGEKETRTEDTGKKAALTVKYLFGSPDNDNPGAGALTVTDMRLLLFPVRSFKGTFAYATCPLAIQRYNELANMAGKEKLQVGSLTNARVCDGSLLEKDKQIFLEDLDLSTEDIHLDNLFVTKLAEVTGITADELKLRLVLLKDDLFTYLTKNATEVVTHVSLKFDTRTARESFLRSEERVPAEALFVGLLLVDTLMERGETAQGDIRKIEGYGQFGGKASTGNGLCKIEVKAVANS